MGQRRHVDAGSELVLDDQAFPLVIATWFGPATLALADHYHRWLGSQVARAEATGRKLVTISDGTHAGRPGAEVRKAFVENQAPADILLGAIVVVDNPMVRGALTAISWVLGDKFDMVEITKTITEGLAKAIEILHANGEALPKPFVVEDYQAPTRTLERTARGA